MAASGEKDLEDDDRGYLLPRIPAPPSFTRTKHEVPWWMKNLTLDECDFFVWQTGSRTFCFHPATPSITRNRPDYETLSPLMDEKTHPG